MKIKKPSSTFIFLVTAAFAVFFGALIYQKYNRFRTDRDLIRNVLTNQRETKHFHIYSDFDQDALDYYEDFLEGFFDYFSREYFEIKQSRPLKVYLFSSTENFIPYARTLGGKGAYGFYMGKRENLIVVNHETGIGTTTHELVHHFIATSFARKPAKWVNEAIATFFEKFIGHLDNNGKLTISFGYFSNWRFPIVKAGVKNISIAGLIEAKETEQCSARSLMLFLHKKGLFNKFVKEIAASRDDRDGLATLQRVYGKSIPELEKEWKEWIKAQPIDADVKLVESSFVLPAKEWDEWWSKNQSRLYWSEAEQIYRVRKTESQSQESSNSE